MINKKECDWNPQKHGGKPCPTHGAGGSDFDRGNTGWTEEDTKAYLERAGVDSVDDLPWWETGDGEEDRGDREAFDDDYDQEFDELDKSENTDDDEEFKKQLALERIIGDTARKNKFDMSYNQMYRLADIIGGLDEKSQKRELDNFFRFNKGVYGKSMDKTLDMLEEKLK